MARISPTPSQKIFYLLCIFIGIGILYVDYNTNFFKKIKYGYESFVISTSYTLKNYTIEPIKKNINQFKSRKTLIKENEDLKKALDISYLNNYLISRENKFIRIKIL